MNNRVQSLTRFFLYTSVAISFTSMVSGCSLITKKQEQVVESTKPDQWYECSTDKDGSGWDCGLGSNSSDGGSAIEAQTYKQQKTNTEPEPDVELATGSAKQAVATNKIASEIEEEVAEVESNTSSVGKPKTIERLKETIEKSQAAYTVQLGAFAGETKRDNFVEANNLQDLPLEFYESIKDGRTWWVLTFGEFSDIEDAKAASDELGDKYGLSDIWIRPLGQLKSKPEKRLTQKESVSNDESGISGNREAPESIEKNEDFYDPHYSIQLAAFKTEQKRDQFISDKGLSELELIYASERRLGELWWIALYGEFELVKDARVKQAEIEAEFGLSGTWIKPIENN